jgi:5-oxoprolinase (ATP-hydrolysing)
MQQAVQFQLNQKDLHLKPGDVILSNHPRAGGSHLPDLTVITPVFYGKDPKPQFFLANRGHHADIGGLTPGSMPPMSTHINEEGAIFISFKIVSESTFQQKELTELFNMPAKFPGCTGSRNLSDNIADLTAQIAANQRGTTLVQDLIDEYTLPIVHKYMDWIQQAAENSVRDLLKSTATRLNSSVLFAQESASKN